MPLLSERFWTPGVHLTALLFLCLFLFPAAGCGDDASGGQTPHGDAGVDDDTGSDEDVGFGDDVSDDADAGDNQDPQLGEIGEPCEEDDECESQWCETFGDRRVCTDVCDTTCEVDGTVCFDEVCTPEDYCDDSIDEGYGEGPGCIGSACDLCDDNAQCIQDDDGEFYCECDDGFDGDGFSCDDIDECAEDTHSCDDNATCTNTFGGYTCACDDGFEGDGFSCDDIDECAEGTHSCDDNATCTNTFGGYTCECDDGFEGDGFSCDDIDECAEGTHSCDDNATCTNTFGGYTCECPETMIGDGEECYYPESCLELSNASPGLADGLYTIDPGDDGEFTVYCDMTTDGGGWTRIANLYAGSRSIDSIYREMRFFHQAWIQHETSYDLESNADVVLDDDTYGMLDAIELFGASTELRFSCEDTTRSLEADAIWTPTADEWTSFQDDLHYSDDSVTVLFSAQGGAYNTEDVYPVASNERYSGNWHICGASDATGGFQVGLCHNAPGVPDNDLVDINQIAIGYHAGFTGLRLECTADTPSNSSHIDGTWEAWVR